MLMSGSCTAVLPTSASSSCTAVPSSPVSASASSAPVSSDSLLPQSPAHPQMQFPALRPLPPAHPQIQFQPLRPLAFGSFRFPDPPLWPENPPALHEAFGITWRLDQKVLHPDALLPMRLHLQLQLRLPHSPVTVTVTRPPPIFVFSTRVTSAALSITSTLQWLPGFPLFLSYPAPAFMSSFTEGPPSWPDRLHRILLPCPENPRLP